MEANRHLITVELEGTRYRGAYSLEKEHLVIEAAGLGRKRIDASIIDYQLGEPATLLAKLAFTELVKENLGTQTLELVAQGSTTQIAMLGSAC